MESITLADVLGVVKYSAQEGSLRLSFEYPDFRNVRVKNVSRTQDADVTAAYSFYVSNMFGQQQKLKDFMAAGEFTPDDVRLQYETVTMYLDDALHHLAGMDSVSLEIVNAARDRLALQLARTQKERVLQ